MHPLLRHVLLTVAYVELVHIINMLFVKKNFRDVESFVD